MNIPGAAISVIIVLVCANSARFGRMRRGSGRPVTSRDTVFAMATSWASGWLAIGLPSLLDWGRGVRGPDVIPAGLSLVALAMAPLALFLAAAWLPRLNARQSCAGKKPKVPHPLD